MLTRDLKAPKGVGNLERLSLVCLSQSLPNSSPWLLHYPPALSWQPVSALCKSPLWHHRGELVNMEKDNLMKTGESSSLILHIKMPILLSGEEKMLRILGKGSEMIQIILTSTLSFACKATCSETTREEANAERCFCHWHKTCPRRANRLIFTNVAFFH